MTDSVIRRRTGGRSARVREAVLKATLELVAENGMDAVSVGEVARRSEVHETSIYRRWPAKENLILEALLDYSETTLPVCDTGSLRSDLITFLTSVIGYLESPLGHALSRAMAITDDVGGLDDGRDQFWSSRLALCRVIIDRAKERGEIHADVDPGLAMEIVIAPAHFRALLTHKPLDHRSLEGLVDLALNGMVVNRRPNRTTE